MFSIHFLCLAPEPVAGQWNRRSGNSWPANQLRSCHPDSRSNLRYRPYFPLADKLPERSLASASHLISAPSFVTSVEFAGQTPFEETATALVVPINPAVGFRQ